MASLPSYGAVDRVGMASGLRLFSPMIAKEQTRIVNRNTGQSELKYTMTKIWKVNFAKDALTTIMNATWWQMSVLVSLSYILSWLIFGCLWYAENRRSHYNCLANITDFSSAFLFSVETQLALGFGGKHVFSSCIIGSALLVIQTLYGTVTKAVFNGLLYAWYASPRNRRHTVLFSSRAVVCERNGARVFQFQVGNMRHDSIVECHVRLQLYLPRLVDGMYQLEQFDLDVGYSNGSDRLFLLTPVVITHHITPGSPLYNLCPRDMAEMDFEIVVVLEGAVEATGLTAQALWSYTKDDVVFDHTFVSVVTTTGKENVWRTDFSHFERLQPNLVE